jgi:tetratricopeptide (TPR) repeat protein
MIVRLACLSLLLVAGLADARPRRSQRATPEPAPDLWQRAIEPNGAAVSALLTKARDVMARPERGMDAEWAVDHRATFFRDAYNLLREARRLSPENTEVLALLGQAADELGKTREAIDALEACIRILGPDRASADVTGRLGALELRLGNRDTAIRWLRYAQGTSSIMGNADWLVYLATALAERGEITAATEVLSRVMPSSIPYFNPEAALVAFSLAVLYDRDEQRAAAFTTLDKMQASLAQMYTTQLQQQLVRFRFVPGEDQHYYLALFYESLGEYIEARAEWALYAASGDTPWRARALDHIAAIDAQRRANPTIKPTQVKSK